MARNAKKYQLPQSPDGYRAELIRLGWGSVRAWAKRHEYPPTTVQTTLSRWANRTDREPHGGISRQIMAAMRQTLTEQRRPQ